MKILLLGANGQVGWELQRALAPLGEVLAFDRAGVDLADTDALAHAVRALAPQAIVNAAAYTAVDRAEAEPELAKAVNAEAPARLAELARAVDAWLLHYSTDYVFDGGGQRPWREGDPAAPLNEYGRSKLAGEIAIRDSGCRHLILRTSWVYSARGGNFIRSMLRLGAQRPRLGVVDDQVGAPTGAELIADTSAHLLRFLRQQSEAGGTYHLAAAGETSWRDYACHVFDLARACGAELVVEEVAGISTAEYPAAAPRPRNSRLDCSLLQETFGLAMPPWQDGVARVLREILNA
ncbi:MAG: dTDP-4-dehydrorhamnose reductase [Rhodocyclaceae bacterium]|nr:dTDP-4-dehydrorhamnose reductase [Rhodocyclaceae bacterium]